MDMNILIITLNILVPTSVISSVTTSYNCLDWHECLFNEYDDKFGNLNKDCWTSMFSVECTIKLLKTTLFVDAISKVLVFVKSKDMSLLYNYNNPWIMSFDVKVLPFLSPLVKKKHISVLRSNYFLYITS
jgi:hypothetical protein